MNRAMNSTMKGLILLLMPISALTIAIAQPCISGLFPHAHEGADLKPPGPPGRLFP